MTESALNEMIKYSSGTYALITLTIVFVLAGIGVIIGNKTIPDFSQARIPDYADL